MGNCYQKCLNGLTTQQSTTAGERCGDDNGQLAPYLLKHLIGSHDSRLAIKGVEAGLDKQNIHATLDKSLNLFAVCRREGSKIYIAVGGVVDIRSNR